MVSNEKLAVIANKMSKAAETVDELKDKSWEVIISEQGVKLVRHDGDKETSVCSVSHWSVIDGEDTWEMHWVGAPQYALIHQWHGTVEELTRIISDGLTNLENGDFPLRNRRRW